MATNNFKPFAIGSGANVISQADYEALSALSLGFQSGVASSSQINKVLRQANTMSSLLGGFIAGAGIDALDNGQLNTLLSNFISALTINLSLKNASKRDVGIGTNQIPDMSSFTKVITSSSNQPFVIFALPQGLIIQAGSIRMTAQNMTVNFPTPFPNGTYTIVATHNQSNLAVYTDIRPMAVANMTKSSFLLGSSNSSSTSFDVVNYVAIGY